MTNRKAFSVPEQKMVDVLIACDAITYAQTGHSLLVASSDLDVLPAVVLASSYAHRSVGLLRSEHDSTGLYEQEMEDLGIDLRPWGAA